MQIMHQTGLLLLKEFRVELRQRYALAGIVLYVVSSVFVIYTILNTQVSQSVRTGEIWNALFWITVLFAGVNAIARSFFQERQERLLYLYTITSPEAVILAKMLYNGALMFVLVALDYLLFTLWLGNAVKDHLLFSVVALLGSLGISFLFSTMSAISSKAGNNATLMAILSFPVVLPLILMLGKTSSRAFIEAEDAAGLLPDIAVLILLDLAIGMLSYILFPYLWRD